ncbi:MAG: hypothetical protein GYB31_06505 [Bacteroidetes bacterium]|nr:hypothetical protein [Bacteroidota bacterium]
MEAGKVYKVKLNSVPKYYHPFILLGVVLFGGLVIWFTGLMGIPVHPFILDYYWWGVLIVVVWELISIRLFFLKEHVEFRLDLKGELTFQYFLRGKVQKTFTVSEVDYWWNYRFRKGGNDEYSTNAGGGMKGHSPANRLNLYVRFSDLEGNEVLLYEQQGNWASTPHWKYDLRIKADFNTRYRAFRLKPLVESLQHLPVAKST